MKPGRRLALRRGVRTRLLVVWAATLGFAAGVRVPAAQEEPPGDAEPEGIPDEPEQPAWSWFGLLRPTEPDSEALLDLEALEALENELMSDLRVVGPPAHLVEGPYEALLPAEPLPIDEQTFELPRAAFAESPPPEHIPTVLERAEPDVAAAIPPEDIDLAGIAPLFGLDSIDHPAVETYIHFYMTDGRSRMARLLARSGRYRDLIRSRLAAAGLPEELLYLVMIESGFDETARSRAGAVGLWQFMGPTARGYGLTVTRRYDERRDPERATDAAIAYLSRLYERFGSWPLAMAGYNAGGGHVMGELRRYNLNDFWAMDDYGAVFDATRRYVYRIIAVAVIGENAERFGFEAVVPEPAVAYETVEVPGNTRLSVFADMADSDVDSLQALNPALLVARTPDVDRYALHIPAHGLEDFLAAQEGISLDEESAGTLHRLRFGETLEDLSNLVGVSVRALREANGLDRDEAPAYGSEVVVPLPAAVVEPLVAAWPGPPPEEADRPVVVTSALRFDYPDRQRVFYAVRSGDELSSVAAAFGVSEYDLAMWNDVDPDAVLHEGLTLQVFVAGEADLGGVRHLPESHVRPLALGSEEYQAWDAAEEDSRQSRRRTYTVRRGDTLSGIARRFGVRTGDLLRWNDLADADRLRAGMELRIR